jgi:hypothetical protein
MRFPPRSLVLAALVAAALSPNALPQSDEPIRLEDVEFGFPVAGELPSKIDLEGRVVLCYHWCVSCPLSTGTFPYVNQLVEKYRDRGLVVIGLQVRRNPEVAENDVVWYLERLQPDFPVTRLGWVCGWPVQVLPWAVVFDHWGDSIFADNLPGIEAVLDEALDAAPDWMLGGPYTKLAERAAEIAADRERIGRHLPAVRKLAARADAAPEARREAGTMVACVERYYRRQVAKAEEDVDGVVERARVYRRLAEMFEGDLMGEMAQKRHEKVRSTPGFAEELKARHALEKARKAFRRLPPPGRYIYHFTDMNYRNWDSKPLHDLRARMITEFRIELSRIAETYPDTDAAIDAEDLRYVNEVPELTAEDAREKLARAQGLIGSKRPYDVREGYLLLHQVTEAYLSTDETARKAESLRALLEGERAGVLAEGRAAHVALRAETARVEELVREGGSALTRERADELAERMAAIAKEAGRQSVLAGRIRDYLRKLDESFAGPAVLGVAFDRAYEGPGVKLSRIYPKTCAERYGLAPGDVILAFGDREIDGLGDLREAITARRAGDEVKLVLRRAGAEGDATETVEGVLGRRE